MNMKKSFQLTYVGIPELLMEMKQNIPLVCIKFISYELNMVDTNIFFKKNNRNSPGHFGFFKESTGVDIAKIKQKIHAKKYAQIAVMWPNG